MIARSLALPVFSAAAVMIASLSCTPAAQAQAQGRLCLREFFTAGAAQPSMQADGEAERLLTEVAQSIGITRGDIRVIPCRFVQKAEAHYVSPGDSLLPQPGRYILYNSDWVREVIGRDRWQAIALFGHELGHFLNDHFTARANISPAEKEREADRFAGCAVARLGGEWDVLDDLLSRLRRDKDEIYPNRVQSIEAAREGFQQCGGDGGPRERPFSLDGPSVNFGCEENQSSTVTYTAPPGYVIANVNAAIARSDNTRSRTARITSNDGRRATAVADFRGLDREFFNCRGGGNGTVRIHGTIIRERR